MRIRIKKIYKLLVTVLVIIIFWYHLYRRGCGGNLLGRDNNYVKWEDDAYSLYFTSSTSAYGCDNPLWKHNSHWASKPLLRCS